MREKGHRDDGSSSDDERAAAVTRCVHALCVGWGIDSVTAFISLANSREFPRLCVTGTRADHVLGSSTLLILLG